MKNKLSLLASLVFTTTTLLAQNAVQTPRIQLRRGEPVPSLGVFMIAYEGLQKGVTTSNPRLIKAMQEVFNEDSRAAEVFAKLHSQYVALSPERRLALVGPELANATPETRIAQEVMRRAFDSPTSKRSTEAVEAHPVWPTDAQMAAKVRRAPIAREPGSAEVGDQPPGVRTMPAGATKEILSIGPMEPPTQTMPKITIPAPQYYSFRYKGFFCSDEGSDAGSSSEPYMILNMSQGDKVWTKLFKHNNIDTYDKVYLDEALIGKSTLTPPLHVEAITMENDSWDPSEVAQVIQDGVSIYCKYETGGDCPKAATDILGKILNWLFAAFQNDDDLVGTPVHETIDPKTYFKSAYHQPSTDHGFLRTEAMLFDGTSTSDGRYWLFFELRKLNP